MYAVLAAQLQRIFKIISSVLNTFKMIVFVHNIVIINNMNIDINNLFKIEVLKKQFYVILLKIQKTIIMRRYEILKDDNISILKLYQKEQCINTIILRKNMCEIKCQVKYICILFFA